MMQGPGCQIRGLYCWWWNRSQMVQLCLKAALPVRGRGQRGQRWRAGGGPLGGCRGQIPKPVPLSYCSWCSSNVRNMDFQGQEMAMSNTCPRGSAQPHLSLGRARELQRPKPWPRNGSKLPGSGSSALPPFPSPGGPLPIPAASPSAHVLSNQTALGGHCLLWARMCVQQDMPVALQ